jgi:hypothetical protein
VRTISEKERKHQSLFNSLIGVVILGLLCILGGFALIGVGWGFHLLSTPLIIIGAILSIGGVAGLVLSYIVIGTPTEKIWKKPIVIIFLGLTLGGIVAYPLLGKYYWGFGILIGICVGIIVLLLVHLAKKKTLPQKEIMTYFSNRLEEIKAGSYVPTYDTFKVLPEFNEISAKSFKTAREQFYSQYFHTTFLNYSKRLEIIRPKGISQEQYIRSQKKKGIILLVVGFVLIPIPPIGLVLIVVGIIKLIKKS